MNRPVFVDQLAVATPQGESGLLAKSGEGYLFGYHAQGPRSAEISLLMPHRIEQYRSRELHPIFQMNLPEGYVLERLRQRLAKAAVVDPMLLLALTGREASIGRVHVQAPARLLESLAPAADVEGRGERLGRILACGARQGSCRLSQAARRCLSEVLEPVVVTTESRSGLSATWVIGDQSRVLRDQRAGWRSRAC